MTRVPQCTLTVNRIRAFAFLVMSPCVWSVGQCDSNGVCTVKGGIKDGNWWRQELNSAQPDCKAIDPQNTGTCHQWTLELNASGWDRVSSIKQMVADYIETTEHVTLKRRVLQWNDPMDELYLSAPKHATGSDKVFVTPHIDGFVGWVPFLRQWRCVYGLTGPHDTVTIQPMRNPDKREVTLGPGVFTCFDYNREIHWIENRPDPTQSVADERMVLKLHFYEYPALLSFVGHSFGHFNAAYNTFARSAFLVSQFPDRSMVAKAVGAVINAITLFGGSTEAVYGYCNVGLVLSAFVAVKFDLVGMGLWSGLLGGLAYVLSLVFRSTTLGLFQRDATSLLLTSGVFTTLAYLCAWAQGPSNVTSFTNKKAMAASAGNGGSAILSLVMSAGGAALVCWAYSHLGADLTFLGQQLAPEAFPPAALATTCVGGPYELMPHPMTVGLLVCLLGLRLHPNQAGFGAKFNLNFVAHTSLALLALALEVTDFHVPNGVDYFTTYQEFSSYHTKDGNIAAHLATTGVALMGVFGFAHNFFFDHHRKSSNKTKKNNKTYPNGPLLTLSLVWLICRFTVPHDDDVAYATVPLVTAFALAAWSASPSTAACLGLVAVGVLGQEFAHWFYAETAFLTAYATEEGQGIATKLTTFTLHNVWLVPFEVRAAINALSASLVPAMVPGTA